MKLKKIMGMDYLNTVDNFRGLLLSKSKLVTERQG